MPRQKKFQKPQGFNEAMILAGTALWNSFDPFDAELKTGYRTVFDEQAVAEYTPLIELNSAVGLSELRDRTTQLSGATVTSVGGEFRLRTGTQGDAYAKLASAERGRYVPGIQAIAGLGLRRPAAPAGNAFWQAGYFDDEDGFFWGEDADGLYVSRWSGGVEKEKVRQADWNVDTLNGHKDNPSGIRLDLTRPTILRINFSWYFSGPAEMTCVVPSGPASDYHTLVMHTFHSTAGEPIVQMPNLPIRVEVDNGGETDATQSSFDVFVGGRQYAVFGRYRPQLRTTEDDVIAKSLNGTTDRPLISFRKKAGRANLAKSIKVAGYDVLSSDDLHVTIVLGGTLTGASFGDLNDVLPSETGVESDRAATAITGGTAIGGGLTVGGRGNRKNLTQVPGLDLEIPEDSLVTLVARKLSGGGGSASAVFRVTEEW